MRKYRFTEFQIDWNTRYGGADKSELSRLKALEDERQPLKRLVANKALNIQVANEAL
ncbi:MAG: hypothetical protein ABJC74_13375 [Gemmatimonadota bacterium]